MPPALSPTLALDYVRELSADVRAVVVLDAAGAALAGDPAVARAARALLAATADAEFEARTPAGVACAVRDDRHALVAACGRFALGGVVRCDLRAVLAALGESSAGPAPATGPAGPARSRLTPDRKGLAAAVNALIAAAERVCEA